MRGQHLSRTWIIQVCKRPQLPRIQCMRFAQANRAMSTAPNQASSYASTLVQLKASLAQIAGPGFPVSSSDIDILHTPADFYQALLSKIRHEEEYIYLSTLYIGKDEHELIGALQDALRSKPKLKVSVLVDALRGTREAPQASCASLLLPLILEFGSARVEIRLFHTPNLHGIRKRIIPKRINEGWGLQHMKLYGTSKGVILSGANLSSDYFTNRQDRYMDFSSKAISDYYRSIHDQMCALSFVLKPDDSRPEGFLLDWPLENSCPSPVENPRGYIAAATQALTPRIRSTSRHDTSDTDAGDTVVYPIIQMTSILQPFTASTELSCINALFKSLSDPQLSSSWTFTAGYFNPKQTLVDALLRTTSTNCSVITAHPHANGFYNSPGISGLLPSAYTLLARRFLQAVLANNSKARVPSPTTSPSPQQRIQLLEWRRGDVGTANAWTYHAKGIWAGLHGERGASVSVLGSSNYTARSYELDLEAGAVLVTGDAELRRRLGDERDRLMQHATAVGLADFAAEERKVKWRVRVAMWLVKVSGGSL